MKLHLTLATTTILFSSVAFATPPADDLLAGPTITEEEVSDQDLRNRKLNETGKQGILNSRDQNRMWLDTFRSLELSDTQNNKFQALLQEMRKEQQEFYKKYGKEMQDLRKTQKDEKKKGGSFSKESSQRMREIQEMSPNAAEYQIRGWAILAEDQQKDFHLKYQKRLDEEVKKREEEKNMDKPMDEMQDRGFAPKDSKFKDEDSMSDGDTIDRHPDAVDQNALRRIKFLRKLQSLQED
jgi:hypothetical protein